MYVATHIYTHSYIHVHTWHMHALLFSHADKNYEDLSKRQQKKTTEEIKNYTLIQMQKLEQIGWSQPL